MTLFREKIGEPAKCYQHDAGSNHTDERTVHMAKADLSADRLRELLQYDPETGLFRWAQRTSNRVKVGSIAGTLDSHGYVTITLARTRIGAHRLAWLYAHGSFPEDDIDHINGNRSDNRLSNLRAVTRSVNLQNQRRPRTDGTSGFLGVTWDASRNLWRAQIRAGGRFRILGRFIEPEAAHAAYVDAKRRLHEGCTI